MRKNEKILIEFFDTEENQTERFARILDILLRRGMFFTYNGTLTFHFNGAGEIQKIDKSYTSWRVNQPNEPLKSPFGSAKVEIL